VTERTITLPAELSSVRRARLFARDVVRGWGLADLVDEVQLGTSELISNAVQHAGTEVVLVLRLDEVLRIEAHDADPELRRPAAEQDDPMATSGRGLQIIAAISTDWGVRHSPRGKAVWFTLPLPVANRPDADVFSLDRRRPADRQRAVEDRRGERADRRDEQESQQIEARAGGDAAGWVVG
jgi:anti-sigma regulatory factor (Ser/Thr protein kinase)